MISYTIVDYEKMVLPVFLIFTRDGIESKPILVRDIMNNGFNIWGKLLPKQDNPHYPQGAHVKTHDFFWEGWYTRGIYESEIISNSAGSLYMVSFQYYEIADD